jgi:hypothetical protein
MVKKEEPVQAIIDQLVLEAEAALQRRHAPVPGCAPAPDPRGG